MTADLSAARPFLDFPPVKAEPLSQSERDAALFAIWQASRELPADAREALLARYASPPSILPGAPGLASDAGEPRHLRQVVGCEGHLAFPPK